MIDLSKCFIGLSRQSVFSEARHCFRLLVDYVIKIIYILTYNLSASSIKIMGRYIKSSYYISLKIEQYF